MPKLPQELQSEADRKASEVERLRAAEKFMTKGTGEGECQGCGYSYTPKEGDDEYPVPKGTRFEVGHAWRQGSMAPMLCTAVGEQQQQLRGLQLWWKL